MSLLNREHLQALIDLYGQRDAGYQDEILDEAIQMIEKELAERIAKGR